MNLTLWCNGVFGAEAMDRLRAGTTRHRWVFSPQASASVLVAGQPDPSIAGVDVAFGQPSAADCLGTPSLRWVQVSSAGYTRYDTAEFRDAFRGRGSALTTASAVFADPCAHHVLAFMLAGARQLYPSYRDQLTDHSWNYTERRYQSDLLTGTTVLLLGFGAIGRRLAELLAPFRCTLYALRRQTRSVPGIRLVAEADLTAVLPLAHHVVNLLPENESTRTWVNARRLACLRPGASFYNVGRGTTVDSRALRAALESGRLRGAFVDVTDPEPLPPDDPLWTAPRCVITPHTAGGRRDQDEAIVQHFLNNLAAFERGDALLDQVI